MKALRSSIAEGISLAIRWLLIWLGAVAVFALGLVAIPVSALIGATVQRVVEMPAAEALMDARELGSVRVLDRAGEPLSVRGQHFVPLKVDGASPALIDAVLATEDRRFYWHFGVDPKGIVRALLVNWRSGAVEQGGSTITQQVVKRVYLTNERRLSRKLQEVPYALAMEWLYSKDDILSIYLSRAYLGAGAYGFGAAAKRYFDVEANNLTVAQSAVLAGLLRAPSRWSPSRSITLAKDRARVVLGAMVDAGRLSEDDRTLALAELEAWEDPNLQETGAYFVDDVLARVKAIRAEYDPNGAWPDDLVVRTTLDREAQSAAEHAMAEVFAEQGTEHETTQAAIVVLDEDAAIRVMIGGRDYRLSQFNRAAVARRQLGSAFKPVIYSAILEGGTAPNTWVHDAPVRVQGWRPRNYGGKYRGWLPLNKALAHSSNAAAVRLYQKASGDAVVALTERFGLPTFEPYPSFALGVIEVHPIDVAAAYAVFQQGGVRQEPRAVVEITDRRGHVMWVPSQAAPSPVLSRRTAEYMTSMMETVVAEGTGQRAQLEDRVVAGKTGTTQDSRDAWFAGFTADYVGVVWIGKDNNESMRDMVGGRIPAEIWQRMMTRLHENRPPRPLRDRPIPELLRASPGAGSAVRSNSSRPKSAQRRSNSSAKTSVGWRARNFTERDER